MPWLIRRFEAAVLLNGRRALPGDLLAILMAADTAEPRSYNPAMELGGPGIDGAMSGWDFGVLPKVGVLEDPDFIRLWGESSCVGMGYGVAPMGSGSVPCLTFIFNNLSAGIQLFHLFKRWNTGSIDGDGVDLALVEDAANSIYWLVCSASRNALIDRVLGANRKDHFSPIVICASIAKDFGLSDRFRWFRSKAEQSPVLLMPGSFAHMPDISFGFIKHRLDFVVRGGKAEKHWSEIVLNGARGEDSHPASELDVPTPKAVEEHRTRLLKRYYPLSSLRLMRNSSFRAATASLLRKHSRSRLLQAGCNLTAAIRCSAIAKGDNIDLRDVYDQLVWDPERSDNAAALTFAFTTASLERQLDLDLDFLARNIEFLASEESLSDRKTRLVEKGYL